MGKAVCWPDFVLDEKIMYSRARNVFFTAQHALSLSLVWLPWWIKFYSHQRLATWCRFALIPALPTTSLPRLRVSCKTQNLATWSMGLLNVAWPFLHQSILPFCKGRCHISWHSWSLQILLLGWVICRVWFAIISPHKYYRRRYRPQEESFKSHCWVGLKPPFK